MATKTVVNISPKVLTGGLCGLGVAVVEAVTVAVTPHSLAFLGAWEPLAIAVLPPLLGQVAAWFKKEQETADTVQAASVVNTHSVEPVLTAPVEPLVPLTADQIIAGASVPATHL